MELAVWALNWRYVWKRWPRTSDIERKALARDLVVRYERVQ
jgi:hypothetical protein